MITERPPPLAWRLSRTALAMYHPLALGQVELQPRFVYSPARLLGHRPRLHRLRLQPRLWTSPRVLT